MLIAQTQPSLLSSSIQKNFYSLLYPFLQVLGASLFIALCAQLSLRLYFTPVPFSGQTFAIMLVGATLGSRKGVWSVLAYLFEGACGLPVFACGSSGFLHLLGPTGGYLLGYILQAYLVGRFIEKQNQQQKEFQSAKTLAALLHSCLWQMGVGVLWLSLFIGFKQAFILGFCPFIVGESLKALGITACLKTLYR